MLVPSAQLKCAPALLGLPALRFLRGLCAVRSAAHAIRGAGSDTTRLKPGVDEGGIETPWRVDLLVQRGLYILGPGYR